MQNSVPYTPRQNGVAERKNKALKKMATCMIEAKDLNPKLWDEAINSATYIQNMALHKSVYGKTHLRLGLITSQIFHISGFLAQGFGLEFLHKRENICSHKERSASWWDMVNINRDTIYFIFQLKIIS